MEKGKNMYVPRTSYAFYSSSSRQLLLLTESWNEGTQLECHQLSVLQGGRASTPCRDLARLLVTPATRTTLTSSLAHLSSGRRCKAGHLMALKQSSAAARGSQDISNNRHLEGFLLSLRKLI